MVRRGRRGGGGWSRLVIGGWGWGWGWEGHGEAEAEAEGDK